MNSNLLGEWEGARISGGYMGRVHRPNWLRRAVARVDSLLRSASGPSFDTIAFTGQSGAAMAYPLGALGWPLTCVRKRGDGSHRMAYASSAVEGVIGEELRYLIVDEQVSTGATIARIRREIASTEDSMKCAGVLIYYEDQPCRALDNLDVPYWICGGE